MRPTPDAEQRRRALDPACSFIVQAPAGSGKTELLIQRYLTLLAGENEPESVVAITFTKKAAGEMRQRVLEALRHAAGPRPEKDHDRLTWDLARAVRQRSEARGWDLYSNPGRLRIRTIDSLCASLTRQMPWLSRMGAPPNILDDARELYAEAARRTIELLEGARWPEAVEAFLIHLDNDFQKAQTLLAAMLARRDQWLRYVSERVSADEAREVLEDALSNAIRDEVEKVRGFVPPNLAGEIVAVVAAAGANLWAAERYGAANACAGMTDMPEPEDLECWLGIVETLLRKDGQWRQTVNVTNGFPTRDRDLKQRFAALMAALSGEERFRAALAELRLLPDQKFAEPQWQALEALIRLLPVAVAQLHAEFQDRGQADYAEVAIAAQRALGEPEEPTDLALSLDCRIRHLLVDEYQDTSVSQYSLLEKLTAGWEAGDGRTVFLVGDPMQSIYRFREAEVGLFLKACREGLGGVPLELLRLSANFRSEEGIVSWVNETFRAVLPDEEDIATGAISFNPSVEMKPAGPGPAVTLHPFIGRDDEGEAAKVVEVVSEARGRGLKVAILVRARSHLVKILPALRCAGQRFRALDIDSLAQQALIRDLTSLTRALLHPGDRIAWLSLLRAPWCGLSLGDLHALAGGQPREALWNLMNGAGNPERLSEDGRERLARLHAALEPVLARRPASLRAWIEGAWLALGGPACADGPADEENAEAFFALIDELEDGGQLDIAALERRIEDLHARPDPEADDGLQILSIHKAKGLQFDVVIVPGLGRRARSDESQLLLWLERPRLGGRPDLLMAPIQATGAQHDRTYDYLKRMHARKSEFEAGRLLYVAATRAKSELHLFGHVGFEAENGVGELKSPEAGSLLERMWSVAQPVFLAAAPATAPQEADGNAARRPLSIRRLARNWQLPAVPPSLTVPGAACPKEPARQRVSYRWAGDTLRHVGTVVHRVLRRIAEDGLSRWDAARIECGSPAYRAALAELGVAGTELERAAQTVREALSRTISDDRGQWILAGKHESAACEYALTGMVEGTAVSLRVDRTFIDETGTRWIVDYKSSSHEGSGVDTFLDTECERYRNQLEGYRRLFAALEDRPVRMGLYFPLLNGWREVSVESDDVGRAPEGSGD